MSVPIEHKVVKDLGPKAAAMSHAEIRALCHAEAMKWVDIQRQQFRRLGVLGDWDNPYLTLDPRYEAGILDVLADLLDDGYIFRQLKPIHWCMTDRTALADFCRAVVLTSHVGALPESLRADFVSAVVDEIARREGALTLDYVRLNLDAFA